MTDINTFPSYIGFGRLRTETITDNDNEISADYFFNEKPVHRVTYRKNYQSWLIRDIINDQGSFSGAKSLEHATLTHFNSLDCSTNPTYQYVENSVCNLGNIYFQHLISQTNREIVTSYYPAGRLVVFRLPILKIASENQKLEFLSNSIQYKNILQLNDTYNSSILSTSKIGVKEIIPVRVFEYIITLASVYDAAEWICVNDLISKEKHLRMIIQDIPHKMETTCLTFSGTPEDNYLNYTIPFKGVNHQKNEFSTFHDKLNSVFLAN